MDSENNDNYEEFIKLMTVANFLDTIGLLVELIVNTPKCYELKVLLFIIKVFL